MGQRESRSVPAIKTNLRHDANTHQARKYKCRSSEFPGKRLQLTPCKAVDAEKLLKLSPENFPKSKPVDIHVNVHECVEIRLNSMALKGSRADKNESRLRRYTLPLLAPSLNKQCVSPDTPSQNNSVVEDGAIINNVEAKKSEPSSLLLAPQCPCEFKLGKAFQKSLIQRAPPREQTAIHVGTCREIEIHTCTIEPDIGKSNLAIHEKQNRPVVENAVNIIFDAKAFNDKAEQRERRADETGDCRNRRIINKEPHSNEPLFSPPRREFDKNQLKHYDPEKILEKASERLRKASKHSKVSSKTSSERSKIPNKDTNSSVKASKARGVSASMDLGHKEKSNFVNVKGRHHRSNIRRVKHSPPIEISPSVSRESANEKRKIKKKQDSGKNSIEEAASNSISERGSYPSGSNKTSDILSKLSSISRKYSELYGSDLTHEYDYMYLSDDLDDLEDDDESEEEESTTPSSSTGESQVKAPEPGPTMTPLEGGGICFQLPGRVTHKTTIKVAHFPRNEPPLMLSIPPSYPGGFDQNSLFNPADGGGNGGTKKQNPSNGGAENADASLMNNCNLYNFGGANQNFSKFDPFKYIPNIYCG